MLNTRIEGCITTNFIALKRSRPYSRNGNKTPSYPRVRIPSYDINAGYSVSQLDTLRHGEKCFIASFLLEHENNADRLVYLLRDRSTMRSPCWTLEHFFLSHYW